MSTIKKFVWIDLEMTGLDAQQDVIIEIATIITSSTLEEQIIGPHHVIHQPESMLATMSPVVRTLHTTSGLINLVGTSTTSLEQAYCETLDFIQTHCTKNEAVLCGNSVWQDRLFLSRYMPQIVSFLHYRLIDVSSIKILINNWYPYASKSTIKKDDHHRALTDIQESIEELRYYQQHFFVPSSRASSTIGK